MKQKKSMYRAGQASLLSMILLASPVLALANSVPVINADQSVGVIGMVSDSGQGTLSATYNLPWTTVPTMCFIWSLSLRSCCVRWWVCLVFFWRYPSRL